jgi:hypothetical protein
MNFIYYYTTLRKITSPLDRIMGFNLSTDKESKKSLY